MLAPCPESTDPERGSPLTSNPTKRPDNTHNQDAEASNPSSPGHVAHTQTYLHRFERSLVAYHIETRGVQRVEPHETHPITWRNYLQAFVLWVSINLAAVNITLGMLAPTVFGLGFRDASLCAVFGALLGSVPVAYIATWGPASGNRTMVGLSIFFSEARCCSIRMIMPGGVFKVHVRSRLSFLAVVDFNMFT